MNRELVEFGGRLKKEREGRALAVVDIARVTKIPERSLELMEAGRFEELPGEVFVRGFLRSYARCVGVDPDETVRRFGELLVAEKPRREAVAEEAAAQPAPVAKDPTPTQELSLLAKTLGDAGLGARRISLTVAVIILVIVATLTLSLLLRRPGHVGNGVTGIPDSPAGSMM